MLTPTSTDALELTLAIGVGFHHDGFAATSSTQRAAPGPHDEKCTE